MEEMSEPVDSWWSSPLWSLLAFVLIIPAWIEFGSVLKYEHELRQELPPAEDVSDSLANEQRVARQTLPHLKTVIAFNLLATMAFMMRAYRGFEPDVWLMFVLLGATWCSQGGAFLYAGFFA